MSETVNSPVTPSCNCGVNPAAPAVPAATLATPITQATATGTQNQPAPAPAPAAVKPGKRNRKR